MESVTAAEAIMEEVGEEEIDSKKNVDAVAELAEEIETTAEVDATTAALDALSMVPEYLPDMGDNQMNEVPPDRHRRTSGRGRESFEDQGSAVNDGVSAADQSEEKSQRRPIDFLIIGVHGIGAEASALAQNKKDLKEHLKFIQAHWFWELEFRTHVELVDWKSDILPRQIAAFSKILPHVDRYKHVQMSGIKEPKTSFPSNIGDVLTDHISDLLSFMTPIHGDFIVESVANHINNTIENLRSVSSLSSLSLLFSTLISYFISIICCSLLQAIQIGIIKIPSQSQLSLKYYHLFLSAPMAGSPSPKSF